MDLKGKVAVVTGATGGLGSRISSALAKEGAKLCLVYAKSKDKADAGVKDILSKGGEAVAVQADVTAEEGISRMLDAAYNEWIPFADLETLDAAKWNYIIRYNLTAPYLAARKVAPLMKKRGGGRIVTVSSIAGLYPAASSIAYAVSKSALQHLTKCLAVALAPEILVNDVAPGLMEGTRMTDNLTPEYAQKARDLALLGRAADKDDVAAAVVLFAKTDSITGQTLVVDSGKVFH